MAGPVTDVIIGFEQTGQTKQTKQTHQTELMLIYAGSGRTRKVPAGLGSPQVRVPGYPA